MEEKWKKTDLLLDSGAVYYVLKGHSVPDISSTQLKRAREESEVFDVLM